MTTPSLICGFAGRDGALRAKLLLDKGYRVSGTLRGGNRFDERLRRPIAAEPASF